jgi:hypothetical protein
MWLNWAGNKSSKEAQTTHTKSLFQWLGVGCSKITGVSLKSPLKINLTTFAVPEHIFSLFWLLLKQL